MRPLRDDDPPGTRVSVLDRTRGGKRYLAVVVELVSGTVLPWVRLRGQTGLGTWLDLAADCRVLEEGDEP